MGSLAAIVTLCLALHYASCQVNQGVLKNNTFVFSAKAKASTAAATAISSNNQPDISTVTITSQQVQPAQPAQPVQPPQPAQPPQSAQPPQPAQPAQPTYTAEPPLSGFGLLEQFISGAARGGFGLTDPYAADPFASGYGMTDPYAGAFGQPDPYAADPYAADPWGSPYGNSFFGPPQTGFGMMLDPYGGRQSSGFGGMLDPFSGMGGGMGMLGPLFGGGGGGGRGGGGGGMGGFPVKKPCRNPAFLRKCYCDHQCGHDSVYYGQCEDYRESSWYAKFCCPAMVHFMCEAFE